MDWTGLDRTGQDRTRGRETRTSKVEEIETDRPRSDRSDRQSTVEQSRRRAEHTPPPATHWHTAAVRARKKMTTGVGDCAVLCCAVCCAVLCWAAVVVVVCAVLSLQTAGLPLSPCNVIGSCPQFVGRFPACSAQRRHPFRFGPPFCCLVRRSAGRAGWWQQSGGAGSLERLELFSSYCPARIVPTRPGLTCGFDLTWPDRTSVGEGGKRDGSDRAHPPARLLLHQIKRGLLFISSACCFSFNFFFVLLSISIYNSFQFPTILRFRFPACLG